MEDDHNVVFVEVVNIVVKDGSAELKKYIVGLNFRLIRKGRTY